MKKFLLCVSLVLFAVTMRSQNNRVKDYSIMLNGNRITTVDDFGQKLDDLKKSFNRLKASEFYTLVQFNEIPSAAEQKKLKEQGLQLLNYLGDNAYYVSVKSSFFNNSTSNKIRTIIEVEPSFKIDKAIINGVIPDYAANGNAVKVVVHFFEGFNSNNTSKTFESLNVKKVKILESFSQAYIEVPETSIIEIAKLNWVQSIELVPPPVQSDNVPGTTSHKANILGSTIAGFGYGLTGKGVKVGIWDSNIERHKDHTGRLFNREYEDPNMHGSHVSGTVMGAGVLDINARGMAPETQIYTWNFNTQSNGLPVFAERELSAIQDEIEITSNSYGINLTSGFNTFRYDNGDRGDDDVMYRFPYLLNVYSNGNAQAAFPGGFNTSTKNSKNALHVAANDHNDLISNYSSFGPTIDGRLVPQIAAIGTNVYSLDYNNSYATISGTSMATPGASGTLALLYERYKNIHNGVRPLGSLMKGLVCNTAKDVGNPGPDYKYGFGNLHGVRAVEALDKNMFYTASVGNLGTHQRDIVVPAGLVSLKVMLAYTDLPATPGATNILVNNLDIKIVRNGVEVLPWVLNPLSPDANATRGVDNLNNIEQITIDNPAAGSYRIIVTGSNVPLLTQEFAVVYDYVAPELKLTYPIGSEKFDPGTTELIRWDYEGAPRTFNIEYSADGGATYALIVRDLPATARNFSWVVPQAVVQNAKIRIIAGSNLDISRGDFSIMAEPKNLVIAPAACGNASFKMDWNPIANARYEVLRLNGNQFDVVATVTDPTFTFTNLTTGENNWFTVRAIDQTLNVVSDRPRAINVEPRTRAVLTALSLPFIENFNDRKPVNYTLSRASTAGSIGFASFNQILLDGIRISGNSTAAPTAWVATSTAATPFESNPAYIKRVTFCEIDAAAVTGKPLRVRFNLIWNSVAANRSFFRLLVNGVPATSADNVTAYGGTALTGNIVAVYDISTVAGTAFNLTMETVIDNNFINPTPTTQQFNVLQIDNVEIFEPVVVDAAITALTIGSGNTASEVISATVYNFSPTAISNVPVSYTVSGTTTVNEIVPGPINPLSFVTYNFTQRADLSVPSLYTITSSVSLPNDAVANNNTITRNVANVGTDILIGSSPSVTTCSAVFTDSGTRFGNYVNNLAQTTTFVPSTASSSIKVDFTAFALETDFDFLFVHDGPTTASPLLGRYTGNTLPPSLTATTAGGQLTFRFTSDVTDVDAGWIANISCVPTPATAPPINDTSILSIVRPDILGGKTTADDIIIVVRNMSTAAATNIPVFYQVNGGAKVTAVIPTIAPLTNLTFTFPTKADLALPNAITITSGIDQADANLTNNQISKVVYNRNGLPTNNNTNGFAISRLRWNDVVNVSGTSAYSDFKSIIIPVYAGFSYQPEVTITKPERPITRDLTTIPGVFTMMVIDLNGDGNLTDEFYAGTFWVNTLNPTSTSTTHIFRNNFTLAAGLTIPAGTTPGEKLMRVIHMFRSPGESFNVNLGPTLDGLTTSRQDFEIEEYTVNVLPFTTANASVESITAPTKPGNLPVSVTAIVRNFGSTPISNVPIAYRLNGGPEVLGTVTATINTAGTTTYTFPTQVNLSATANHSIEVYTKLVGDTDSTNDSKTITLSKVGALPTNVTGTLDGINDFMASDVTPALDLRNSYTYEAWINQRGNTIFGRLLDKGTVLIFSHNDFNLGLYTPNSLVVSITTAGGSYVLNTGANSIQQNRWHHVALTVSSANVYTVYIDGVVAPTAATGVAAIANTNAANRMFIGNNAGLARGFNGNIDEVRVWNVARTQAEIAANLTTKFIGNEPGLAAYYSLSEGDKQFVYDGTVSDNTAIVSNADTNGIGAGKFWNVPLLLQRVQFNNQLSTTYDAATRTYTVLLNDGFPVTSAVANYTLGMGSIAKINGVTQTSGVTANDFTNPVTLVVEGIGFNTGLTETYTIRVLTGLNNQSTLLSYNFNTANNPTLSQPINTTIVGSNASASAAPGTNVSNLRASFTLSPGAELLIDGVVQNSAAASQLDYSRTRIVTVVSENKISRTNYTINVDARNTAGNFVSYTIPNQFGPSVINPLTRTILIKVNNFENLTALVPTFQISSRATARIGTYLQNSGVTLLNYTAPVVYTVQAENGTFVNWTLTIERDPLSVINNAIDGFSIYPNPVTQGKVFVVAATKASKNIRIFDIVGKQVFAQDTENEEINVSSLQQGVYIIKVLQEGKTAVKKLVIE